MMYLNPQQVTDLIKQAEREQEVIVIRCVRKTPASKPNGPGIGSLYDLHCSTKPAYTPRGFGNREAEDRRTGTLTVFVTNRRNVQQGTWGAWRRVNISEVQKVIYKSQEFEVRAITF
jgi:hypothetical protein